MPRRRQWLIDGQAVTASDIRRWMQSVGARIPERNLWDYVKQYDVPGKIAAAKARGEFDQVVHQAAQFAGVKVRAARRPGALAQLAGRPAANDPSYQPLGTASSAQASSVMVSATFARMPVN